MGLLKSFIRTLWDYSSHQLQGMVYDSQECYTPEEFVIYEQEKSGECWHGVPLSELSRVAQKTYRGKSVKVDDYGFLVFKYSSKSRKTSLSVQCKLDESGQLTLLSHNYYPGQWQDSADEFVELVNQEFTFY